MKTTRYNNKRKINAIIWVVVAVALCTWVVVTAADMAANVWQCLASMVMPIGFSVVSLVGIDEILRDRE